MSGGDRCTTEAGTPVSRCRRRWGNALPGRAQAGRPGGRRRSGSRPRSARRGRRRGPGSRSRRRPALPLRGADVRLDVARRQRPERDARLLGLDHFPRSRAQAEPRDDHVRPARERSEHPLRLGRVGRLRIHAVHADHCRIDAEHGPPVRLRGDQSALAPRVLADERHRVGVRRVVLDVVGCDDLEQDAGLLEDRAPLRRGRGEQERRSRRPAHAFRATQISSAGHCRAHSTLT